LASKTLKLAMEGQIFDEGKELLAKTVKEGFPSPGTGPQAAALLPHRAAGIRLMAKAPGLAARASFRLA